MSQSARIGSFCLLAALSLSGCTSFLTARAIEEFSASLEAGNVAQMRQQSSESFQQRALRREESDRALRILPLPKGNVEVVKVDEVSDDERLVTVAVGEEQTEIQYRLIRTAAGEGKTGKRWVVDDVLLTQTVPGSETPLTKSVTEQMDLLLTVQEFLESWRTGTHDQALSVLHPELAEVLSDVSPAHFAQITKEMMQGVSAEAFRPEVRMKDREALVQLPRRGGKLILKLEQTGEAGDTWKVSDVGVESRARDESLPALSEMATLIGNVSQFLTAYDATDRASLERLVTERFFQTALATADLSIVKLPTTRLQSARFDLEQHGSQSDLLFELDNVTYLVSLRSPEEPEVAPAKPARFAKQFLVDEVTIYEGSQVKPLSTVFTAHAVVEMFAEALARRDHSLLQQLSTRNFTARVWGLAASDDVLQRLPLDGVPAAPPRIVTTIFQGHVTEVTVTQGTRAMTYVLHSTRGRPQVDDILIAVNDRPGSLKETLECLVPLHNFAEGWDKRDRQITELNTSKGVGYMVWIQLKDFPDWHISMTELVSRPLASLSQQGGDRIVTLGTTTDGVRARLTNTPNGRLVLDEFHLYGPQFAGGHLDVLNSLRHLANQAITISSKTPVGSPRSPEAALKQMIAEPVDQRARVVREPSSQARLPQARLPQAAAGVDSEPAAAPEDDRPLLLQQIPTEPRS